MRVLITGAGGTVGRPPVKALEAQHELRLGDVNILDDPRYVPLDVTKPKAVHRAMAGMDAVVHLAVASGHEGDYEDDDFNQRRFDVNVKGTWNVLNAAAKAGVKRVVHTSSIMVTWAYPPGQWVPADAPPKPEGTYATTKLLAEVLCEQAAKRLGLSIVCLRISKPVDTEDPALKAHRIRPQWIAFSELAKGYALALTVPNIGFEILTLVGDSTSRRWDLSKAETILGYRPSVRLEDLGYTLGEEREPYPEIKEERGGEGEIGRKGEKP
jgi:uronate dehydrogenase